MARPRTSPLEVPLCFRDKKRKPPPSFRRARIKGKARTRDSKEVVDEIARGQKLLGPDAVQIGWVKIHNGLAGNEKRDSLVKIGKEKEGTQVTKAGLKQWWKAKREKERKVKGTGMGRVIKTGKGNLRIWLKKLDPMLDSTECRRCGRVEETGPMSLWCAGKEKTGQKILKLGRNGRPAKGKATSKGNWDPTAIGDSIPDQPDEEGTSIADVIMSRVAEYGEVEWASSYGGGCEKAEIPELNFRVAATAPREFWEDAISEAKKNGEAWFTDGSRSEEGRVRGGGTARQEGRVGAQQ
ncbi:hypothetical protein EV426DRAFT_714876 [Tirmania nivea]|nr:hypothetical protein EV426DRAFT_714876 [Tirmania nivea]